MKNPKKQTICLNMIVKNESHVITRCLESTLPLIDYWVIIDTGSTDGTQEIIKDYMKQKNIPGELHEQLWVNFGHNREEALALAKFKADYILFIDADDILDYEENFKLPSLTQDCYLIQAITGHTDYLLTRLIKSSLDWHWYGVIHEYVMSKLAKNGSLLKGVKYFYLGDGARSKDPQKYIKDIKILLEALEKEPDNPRYMFYLAQTYASNNDLENAIKCYQKRVKMEDWDQEVFWSLLQIAQIQKQLNHDDRVVIDSYIKALEFRPSRTESYYYLVNYARMKKEYEKGYELARVGIGLKETKDSLFVEKWTHDALLLEFSICAWWTEKYDECLEACNQLLKKTDLNHYIRHCAMLNKEQALEKLQEREIISAVDEIFLMDKDKSEQAQNG